MATLEATSRELRDQLSRRSLTAGDAAQSLARDLEKERRRRAELAAGLGAAQAELRQLQATATAAQAERKRSETAAVAQLAQLEESSRSQEETIRTLRQRVETAEANAALAQKAQQEAEASLRAAESAAAAAAAEASVAAVAQNQRVAQLSQDVSVAQRQFELVSRRYDETLQLVALLRKQNAPAEVAPVAQVAQLEESVRVLEGKLATATGVSERLRRDASVATSELSELKLRNDELARKAGEAGKLAEELVALRRRCGEMARELEEWRGAVADLREERVGVSGRGDGRTCTRCSYDRRCRRGRCRWRIHRIHRIHRIPWMGRDKDSNQCVL